MYGELLWHWWIYWVVRHADRAWKTHWHAIKAAIYLKARCAKRPRPTRLYFAAAFIIQLGVRAALIAYQLVSRSTLLWKVMRGLGKKNRDSTLNFSSQYLSIKRPGLFFYRKTPASEMGQTPAEIFIIRNGFCKIECS